MANPLKSFEKLVDLIKLEKKEIGAIYFFAIFNGLVQLSLPLGIQAIIGFVLGATLVTSVYVLIFFIVLGTLLVGALSIFQMNLIEKVQQKIFVRYSLKFAQKIPQLDLLGIDKFYLPEKINYFFDTLTVQKGLSKLLLDIPIASIQILLGLLLLSLYHPLFIVFSFLLLLILFILLRFTSNSGIKTSLAESNYKYKVAAWLQETGRVIKAFKFSGNETFNIQKTDNKLLDYLDSRTAHYKVLMFQYKSIVFFKVSITALMLIIGVYLLFNQSLNIGEFVAVELVILTVISALEKTIISLENIYDVITGLVKIDSVIENPSELNSKVNFNTSLPVEIELQEVSFSYNMGHPVIENANLNLTAGKVYGITGKDGSGKSTLIRLLLGLYNNYTGSIFINGIPLANYNLNQLRSQMGVFTPENDLFEGTVYENITLGKNISIEAIMDLARELGIEDFIRTLPHAFETALDPQGNKLPSTISRKILLIRAFINNPSFLILEEPWQGLEAEAKTAIANYLIKIAKNKLVIIVSNDRSLLNICQQKINVEKNKISIKE